MANVNIFIADVFELTKMGTFAQTLLARVNALYGDCIAFANRTIREKDKQHSFRVSIATTKPAPGQLDVLIYLLPVDFHSISGSPTRDNLLADHWGFTSADKKSEIIVKQNDGDIIGSLVIHELLHYKTGKGNADLHKTGGLGAATVGADSKLNDANRNDVATTLTREMAPFIAGWDICAGAKRAKEAGDPFWNL